MIDNGKILFAKTGEGLNEKVYLEPKMANRHGFIGGATGTGKTFTLKVLAESFSELGVPVFLADVKGDLSSLCKPGEANDNMNERIARFKLEGFDYRAYPIEIFDIFGQNGIPLRTTVSEMGPTLMATILDLNSTQSDILSVVYKIADDQDLLLCDTKDLKAILQFASENAAEFEMEYGRIASQSVSAIIRAIVALESHGGEQFFGDPAINVADFFQTDAAGQGKINILDSRSLINNPRLYSAFMLYLLSELFEVMPEVGDLDKPRMVFFFDEAHLLFNNVSKALLEKIEQTVKLIRSKGIGIYFISQSPIDIPDSVMSQLGNKIEHALRAYTPKDQKALKTVSESFRANPDFNTQELLQKLGTGEAVVSTLGEDGIPGIACHAYILPPKSQFKALEASETDGIIKTSNLYLRYNQAVDVDSAYEFLKRRQEQFVLSENQAKEAMMAEKEQAKIEARRQREVQRGVKSIARTAGGSVGRELGNILGKTLGGSFGKRLGGNVGASIGRNILGTFFK